MRWKGTTSGWRIVDKNATIGDEHQTGLGTRHQQRGIIEAQPRPILPSRDVNDRKHRDPPQAG